MDKASIAALNATLLHYAKGEAEREVPVWRMISTPVGEIDRRARRWARALGDSAGSQTVRPEPVEGRGKATTALSVLDGRSMIGGGSLPEESLPARILAIEHPDVEGLAKRLRLGNLAIIGRVDHGRLLLDPRTVHPRDDAALIQAVRTALGA